MIKKNTLKWIQHRLTMRMSTLRSLLPIPRQEYRIAPKCRSLAKEMILNTLLPSTVYREKNHGKIKRKAKINPRQ